MRESVELINASGAQACGVAIALDRQEKGLGQLSAVQEVVKNNRIPVCAIANLTDLLKFIESQSEMAHYLLAIQQYLERYGC